jgi:hypothetical protein
LTRLFHAVTRLEAWLDATEYLLANGADLNVVLDIAAPASDGSRAAPARALVDAFLRSESQPPLHTVAETIFPGWEYRRRGIKGVFENYVREEYPLIRQAAPYGWGTYAHRLLERRTAAGETMNPLATLIEKMRSEVQKESGGPFKSCYEVGIAEGAYDLPLYNTVDDHRRRRGGPCLSHLSFKLLSGQVHLTAIYRSHDYRYKVLGNLLGLARLQACVAQEVGAKTGTLVVHSTYAYIEGGSKGRLKKLVSDLRALDVDGGQNVAGNLQ